MKPLNRLVVGAVLLTQAAPSLADHRHLETVIVTAPTEDVLTVTTDAKAPRQPMPAQDGADLLKNIPGFAVTRKGGTDGDPLFRGMAASRLSILLDGETILGGCGNRMDPPTAYIFPEAFDTVTILKGPQSVKYGAGSSAGVVMFERAIPDFTTKPVSGYVSAVAGSFGRNDQVGQVQAGGTKGYVHLNGTRTDADNYKDGDGNEVHSRYTRWSTNAAFGWTPNTHTRFELSLAKSDGEAAYGDRGMDGSQFDRSNVGLSYEQHEVSPLIARVKARVYRNYVDHIMDNFSLREAPMMAMLMNPDRETLGGNVLFELALNPQWTLDIGMDHQENAHTMRSASSMMGLPSVAGVVRHEDMNFATTGVFVEANRRFTGDHSVHMGLRVNHDRAEDLRMNKTTTGAVDDQSLISGFLRYEHQWSPATRLYAGLGHSERAADYWERTRNPEATSGMMTGTASTFWVNPEETTQLDIGLLHQHKGFKVSLSAFAAEHNDYILVEALNAFATDARNIRAITYGAEADIVWQFAESWNTVSTLAWVQGKNASESRPLGQMPAPEMRLGLNYEKARWSTGILWRGVAKQDRVAPGQGNIVGQDIGETSGYGIVSLSAAYRFSSHLLMTAGIDNLFDRSYAEHISRSGASIPGFETTTRINEPGRNLWMKAQWMF